jgi:hypothetical protein
MMKEFTVAGIAILLFAPFLWAQTLESTAREVWSEPVRIFPTGTAVYPAVSSTGDTLYCVGIQRLSRSIKISGVWSSLQPLPSGVNTSLAKHPAITPDGRRLYFIEHDRGGGYGGWDLWMTEWSDGLKDWGEAENLGPTINTDGTEWCAFAPDNRTLIFVRGGLSTSLLMSHWLDSAQSWSAPTSFDRERAAKGWSVDGLTMPRNQRKVYLGRYTQVNGFFEWELMVSYKDSITLQFGDPYRLNMNSHPPDTAPKYNPENRGYDGFPSVTPDGKWMFFESDRSQDSLNTNYHDIYVSRLLVDENGDTVVTSVYDEFLYPIAPVRLFPNYPNPFNPSTTIVFELAREQEVKILLVDVRGRLVRVLADSMFNAGTHTLQINLGDLPSGTYFYQIRGRTFQSETRKLLLVQ